MRFLLKAFVKPGVVNEVPYKRNIPTAPAFRIKNGRDFAEEKASLISFVEHTQSLVQTMGSVIEYRYSKR